MDHQADTDVQRVVRSTGRTWSVLLRRTFPATVEQLWTTCTEPVLLARWYGDVTGDMRLGGSLQLADVAATCEVLRCEAPSRLDVSWRSGDDTTVVRLSLRPVDDGAELTLEQLGIASSGVVGYGSGWERELGRLETFLAGGTTSDHSSEQPSADRLWQNLPAQYDVRWGRVDGSDSVTIDWTFDVAADRVWAAVSTPSGLGSWFGSVSGELRVGGQWSVSFDDGSASGTVTTCEPQKGFTTSYVQGIHGPDDVHSVQVTLAPADGSTRLTLVHAFPADATPRLRTGMTAGWNAYLAALDASLGGRPVTGADWMADFRIALVALG